MTGLCHSALFPLSSTPILMRWLTTTRLMSTHNVRLAFMLHCHPLDWSTACTGLLRDQPPCECVPSILCIFVSFFLPGKFPPDQEFAPRHQELATPTAEFGNDNLNKRDSNNSSIENRPLTASSRIGRGNRLIACMQLFAFAKSLFYFSIN